MGAEATGPRFLDILVHMSEQTSPSHDGAFLPTSAHKPMMHGDMDRKWNRRPAGGSKSQKNVVY